FRQGVFAVSAEVERVELQNGLCTSRVDLDAPAASNVGWTLLGQCMGKGGESSLVGIERLGEGHRIRLGGPRLSDSHPSSPAGTEREKGASSRSYQPFFRRAAGPPRTLAESAAVVQTVRCRPESDQARG